MTDSSFRSYRSHDPLARAGDRAPARARTEDPLAELARLIGQGDPVDDFGRDAVAPPVYDPAPAARSEWAADDRYAEANEPPPESSTDRGDYGFDEPYDEGYDEPPRLADPEAYPAAPAVRELAYDPPGSQFRGLPQSQVQQHSSQPLPSFLPRARDDRYEYDDEAQDGTDDQSYALEDYEEEAPSVARRGGFVVVAIVLALAVLGTAGAFAYRAMFGGSMLPSLPPIIKADTGPNKIVPSAGNYPRQTADQANPTSAASGEKLVSREENPVDVPAPVSTAPRVVSTIPIFPAPNSPPAGALASAVPGTPMALGPAPASPAMTTATAAPAAPVATAPAAAPVMSPEPKKIHTVAIRPDQSSAPDAAMAAAAALPMQPAARVTAQRPVTPPAARAAPAPETAGGNGPLSILPGQGDALAPAPQRTRTAAIAPPTALNPTSPPTAAEAPSAAGGYAVQVTSQRSEAEAQAAFRALRAKYPAQLGSQEPIVRRADLGAKGVFYRALVGPFASMEQAAGICSSLKAAGGNCIVQRN